MLTYVHFQSVKIWTATAVIVPLQEGYNCFSYCKVLTEGRKHSTSFYINKFKSELCERANRWSIGLHCRFGYLLPFDRMMLQSCHLIRSSTLKLL